MHAQHALPLLFTKKTSNFDCAGAGHLVASPDDPVYESAAKSAAERMKRERTYRSKVRSTLLLSMHEVLAAAAGCHTCVPIQSVAQPDIEDWQLSQSSEQNLALPIASTSLHKHAQVQLEQRTACQMLCGAAPAGSQHPGVQLACRGHP
jgi:hypothetical protein